jgi:outer membrane protein OmpA-like peptidoglycan-associated protein/opacity protein-like surface antigen
MSKQLYFAALLGLGSLTAWGQSSNPYSPAEPKAEVSAGFAWTGANAPPSGCQCFGMPGASIATRVPVHSWLDVTGKAALGHNDHISSLGQNLTLFTYMAGPTVTLQAHRFTPFGQFLLGDAHATGSWFPSGSGSSTSSSSFAWSPGAGVDFQMTPRLSLRPLEIDYLHTGFPNGSDNSQSQLQLQAGITLRFGGVGVEAAGLAPPPHPAEVVNFACEVTSSVVSAGDPVRVVGSVMTNADHADVRFHWTLNGNPTPYSDRNVTIATENLAPGAYIVEGHAYLVEEPSVGENCSANFRISAKAQASIPPRPVTVQSWNSAPQDKKDEFDRAMVDAFFDLNSSSLRDDDHRAVTSDADYLKSHPAIRVVVAGFADERGPNGYNMGLAMDRAKAMRDALVAAGIDAARIDVESYGKNKAFCTVSDEGCYQQNRRAQLVEKR